MIVVPVFNMAGESAGEMEIDPEALGGRVRHRLIKQAIVAYLDHQRQHSARTKGRSDVSGSTKKLYRQKGTGNARAGMRRTPIRRGGGMAFAKRRPLRTKEFPKKMRRLARNSAVLAKIEAGQVMIIDDLAFPEVRTKALATMLAAIGAEGGCLLATHQHDRNMYLSGRNIPKTEIRVVEELTAYEVLRRGKLIFSKQAFGCLAGDPVRWRGGDEDGSD